MNDYLAREALCNRDPMPDADLDAIRRRWAQDGIPGDPVESAAEDDIADLLAEIDRLRAVADSWADARDDARW